MSDPREPIQLNERAHALLEAMLPEASHLGVRIEEIEGGGRIVDCGVRARGGLAAGVLLARLAAADLLDVRLAPAELSGLPVLEVQVFTDHPVAACMAAQYAGWRISRGGFFAMGSGPFRALHRGEELLERLGWHERADRAVGVLESSSLPPASVFEYVSEKTAVARDRLTLAVAPTSSPAGGVQVVARSVETALHKLHELGFDLQRVRGGAGRAPLPPPAAGDLESLGRTNDAVLYGARVILWVTGDDASLAAVGRQVPSSTSPDHGAPFAEIFARYDRDFYRIDPHLFSPAEVIFHNLETGATHHFGRCEPDLLRRSFFLAPPSGRSIGARVPPPPCSAPRGSARSGQGGAVLRSHPVSIAVLAASSGWHVEDLQRAGRDLGVEVQLADFRCLLASLGGTSPAAGEVRAGPLDLTRARGVLVREVPGGSLEQVVFRMDALHALEARGVRVLNRPRALETAVDKYLSLVRLAGAGLPVPATTASESPGEARAFLERLGGKAVMKPLFGSQGRGLKLLEDPAVAEREAEAAAAAGRVVYLQEFVDHPGWDLRAFVAGGRVLACMRRRALGGWITNLAQGGRGEAVEPEPEVVALALAAARAVGAEIAGVDLVPDRSGRLRVLEVNAAPGWRGIQEVSGVDVARRVLEHLLEPPPRPGGGGG